MAPKRGRGRKAPAKRRAREEDVVPDIYQDMLAEAARNPLSEPDLPRRLSKRRRLGRELAEPTDAEFVDTIDPHSSVGGKTQNGRYSGRSPSPAPRQTVLDDFASSAGESDDDFEDVDLDAEDGAQQRPNMEDEPIELDFSKKLGFEAASTTRRRKPAGAAERRTRLALHKWHVLCLIAYLQRRNQWCEDEQVQSLLRPLIPRKTVRLLHLDASQPQFQRNHSFNSALEDICKIWRSEWKITEQGLRRAHWKEEPDDLMDVDELPDPTDLDDFRGAAKTRSGSRDLGAQLFCSLLRAVAVDTRLVFSLQTLPFSGVAKGTTPEKPKAQYITASSLGRQPQWDQDGGGSDTVSKPGMHLYDAEPNSRGLATPSKRAQKKIRDSPYPILWVEVFNEALQKWIPIDPIVRSTINKPKTGFEPPANDALNSMTYVIAFEDDGSAKDVTRRYAQFYNGKTRRNRVESTKGGARWWRQTISFLEKPFPEDRDEIENAELLGREESEQMPKNVQDFKHHPYYALERHLRRNEVIHPRREIGKVSVGQSKDAKLEPVFRRRDVVIVRTADQWYRRGRDVKMGEVPLKRVVLQRRRGSPVDTEGDEHAEGAMLYAEFQTEVYIPPAVVNGKIPKNVFGNLDVYVPTMIPPGGIHVQHPDAVRAAKVLGIDYADAVTGFEFKGRHGTAVLNGIVAAAEYRDALVEVVEGIVHERVQEMRQKRTSTALQMWKRFLTGLRIRDRVQMTYNNAAEGGGSAGEEENDDGDDDMEDTTYQDTDQDVDVEEDGGGGGGGGFIPEQDTGPATWERPADDNGPTETPFLLNNHDLIEDAEVPIIIHESPHKHPQEPQPPAQSDNLPPDSTPFTSDLLSAPEPPPLDGAGFLHDDDDNTNTTTTSNEKREERAEGRSLLTDDPHERPANPSPPSPLELPRHPSTNSDSPAITTTAPVQVQVTSPSGSELEQGSLLSHDPEDEDAEPEWLAGVVDSD